MDDSLLTKCPHCQTLFRIQQDHLAAAGGEVRCGVCYKVFDASNEGVAYSQGEGSPADKTFGRSSVHEEQALPETDEAVDTSPEPDPNQARTQAKTNYFSSEQLPSPDDIEQLQIASSSISELVKPETTRGQRLSLKWTCLSLLAAFGLFAQWLTFHFESNAYKAPWHNLYVNACKVLNCKLPPYQNVSLIKTERLAIKTHPDYDNVLIVDMIINNLASQAQPLPLLDMAFYSMNGQPIAQRLLQPEEYLGQHLKYPPPMPSKTPVHLSFAILDPGSKAVNYSINLTPAS
jgi:predicted Zn finger-like uncharacterized protein